MKFVEDVGVPSNADPVKAVAGIGYAYTFIRSRPAQWIGRKVGSGSGSQGEVVGDAVLFFLLLTAAPEALWR